MILSRKRAPDTLTALAEGGSSPPSAQLEVDDSGGLSVQNVGPLATARQ